MYMQVKVYDITEMSNREIEDLCHMCEVELQERRLAQEEIYKDALTNHLFIDEVSEDLRKGYHDWLKENLHHPAACDIIEQYYSDEQYKEAIRKGGA
jgi:hypothetical protein